MDYKQLIMEMRINKELKGKKAAVVMVAPNVGRVYKEKKALTFIMSVGEEMLHFQGLTKILKAYKKELDFDIRISDIKSFTIDQKGLYLKIVTLYTVDGFYLPFSYYFNIKNSYDTQVNIETILKEFKVRGVKKGVSVKDIASGNKKPDAQDAE